MVIKFDPLNKPSFITQDFLVQNLDEQGNVINEVIGYYITLNGNDIRVTNGDYFIVNNSEIKVILRSEYLASADSKRIVVKEIAIELLENIIQAFVDLATTDLIKLDILKTVGPCVDMIIANKIQAARIIAAIIPTTTNFTNARKNALLALIDESITKL